MSTVIDSADQLRSIAAQGCERGDPFAAVDFDHKSVEAELPGTRAELQFSREVFKFGGSRLRDRSSYMELGQFMAEKSPLAIVVSARYGVTNELEDLLMGAREGAYNPQALADLWSNHLDLCSDDNREVYARVARCFQDTFGRMHQTLTQINIEGDYSDQQRAFFMSRGEFLSGLVLKTHQPDYTFSPSEEHMVICGSHLNGSVDLNNSLAPPPGSIVTGFYGMMDGEHALVGRGGSDYIARVVARQMGAEQVTLVKDVPGVLPVDPRIVDDAPVVPSITRQAALSAIKLGGFGVVHPGTLEIDDDDVAVRVTDRPEDDASGTRIVHGQTDQSVPLISGRGGVSEVRFRFEDLDAENGVAVDVLLNSLRAADHFVFETEPGRYIVDKQAVVVLQQAVAELPGVTVVVDGDRSLIGLVSDAEPSLDSFLRGVAERCGLVGSMERRRGVGDVAMIFKVLGGEEPEPGNNPDFVSAHRTLFDHVRKHIPAFEI